MNLITFKNLLSISTVFRLSCMSSYIEKIDIKMFESWILDTSLPLKLWPQAESRQRVLTQIVAQDRPVSFSKVVCTHCQAAHHSSDCRHTASLKVHPSAATVSITSPSGHRESLKQERERCAEVHCKDFTYWCIDVFWELHKFEHFQECFALIKHFLICFFASFKIQNVNPLNLCMHDSKKGLELSSCVRTHFMFRNEQILWRCEALFTPIYHGHRPQYSHSS